MRRFFFKRTNFKIFSAALFLLAVCFYVDAEKAVWEIGGNAGWKSIDLSENIAFRPGRYSFKGVGLSSPSQSTEEADLFLTFDDGTSADSAGFYETTSSSPLYAGSGQAKYGEGALLCEGLFPSPSLVLTPRENAFFAGGSTVKSFTIEFWLKPENTESGSIVFRWRSSLKDRSSIKYQNIAAEMQNNKLVWSLFNLWRNKNNSWLDIKLNGKSNLIPEKWSHHLLTYNENSGLLEYRIDGKTENLIHLTETGQEGSSVLYSMLGSPAQVFIGIGYSGIIDEFKVTRKFLGQDLKYITELPEKYDREGGFFRSKIIDTGGIKSVPKFLKTDLDTPPQTSAVFFIRASDSKYGWTENYPAWKPVCQKKEIEKIQGRYMQIACRLYPDGKGKNSPIVHSLKLEYEKDTLPIAPVKLFAESGDGEVRLSWSPSIDFDVKGYLIFAGDSRGQYLLKNSPIDAGKTLSFTIKGLENGKLYFFSVAAYDDNGKEQAVNLSKEVWARPVPCP